MQSAPRGNPGTFFDVKDLEIPMLLLHRVSAESWQPFQIVNFVSSFQSLGKVKVKT